jgi:hypothetical protein
MQEVDYLGDPLVVVRIDRIRQFPAEIDRLARADGFSNAEQFFEFFRYQHGFPFAGQLIEW